MQWVTECPSPESWRSRIVKHVEVRESGCHVWTGNVDTYGYGRFTWREDGRKRVMSAARAAWLAEHGKMADGLVIDHLCRNRLCVRLDHLEPVTNRINIQRGEAGRPPSTLPDFPCGHPRDKGNTLERVTTAGYTHRSCRECNRLRSARHKAAKRQK